MINGSVNKDLEAIIEVVVIGAGSHRQQLTAVIDTGFSGFLTLPSSLAAQLQLPWLGREPGELADGSIDYFDVYRASVDWDGVVCPIEVQAANAQPLVGMALMKGYSLRVDVVIGGAVNIADLP